MKTLNKLMVLSIVMIYSSGLIACNNSNIHSNSQGKSEESKSETKESTIFNSSIETTTNSESSISSQTTTSSAQNSSPSVHVHEYGEWTIVSEATLVSEGLKEHVCECGEKETMVIPQLTYQRITEFGTVKETGNYILFGFYPQKYVYNEKTIAALNEITEVNSLGYLEYNGEQYTKATAKKYIAGANYTFSNNVSIEEGKEYYCDILSPLIQKE